MSPNTIKEIRRLLVGDGYIAGEAPGKGGGYYEGQAIEPGYWILLADSCVFIADRQLEGARQARETAESSEPAGDTFDVVTEGPVKQHRGRKGAR